MGRPRILVTGASRRIGRALAVELARRECDLVLTSRAGKAGLFETVAAVTVAAPDSEPMLAELHLDDPESIAALAASIGEGPLDGIVHNASSYEGGDLDTLDHPTLHRDLDVHAVGPLLLTRALRGALERSTLPARPAVVMPLDIHAAGRPRRGFASYLLAKAAMGALVELLAVELGPSIRSVGVSLGAVLWPEGSDPDTIQRYEMRVPLERSGTGDDAVAAIAWALLEASFVTGTTVRVDGGRWLR